MRKTMIRSGLWWYWSRSHLLMMLRRRCLFYHNPIVLTTIMSIFLYVWLYPLVIKRGLLEKLRIFHGGLSLRIIEQNCVVFFFCFRIPGRKTLFFFVWRYALLESVGGPRFVMIVILILAKPVRIMITMIVRIDSR